MSRKPGVINCFAQDNIKFRFAKNRKLTVYKEGGSLYWKSFSLCNCFKSRSSSFHRQQKRNRKQKCSNYRRPLFCTVNMNYCLASLYWRASFILAFTGFASQRGDRWYTEISQWQINTCHFTLATCHVSGGMRLQCLSTNKSGSLIYSRLPTLDLKAKTRALDSINRCKRSDHDWNNSRFKRATCSSRTRFCRQR